MPEGDSIFEDFTVYDEDDDWVDVKEPNNWHNLFPITALKERSWSVWTSYGISFNYMPFLQEVEKT